MGDLTSGAICCLPNKRDLLRSADRRLNLFQCLPSAAKCSDLGRLAWERPLVADLGRLAQEHPLVTSSDRLAWEQPLVADFGRLGWERPQTMINF